MFFLQDPWSAQLTVIIKKHPIAWGTPGVLAILLTYFMKSIYAIWK